MKKDPKEQSPEALKEIVEEKPTVAPVSKEGVGERSTVAPISRPPENIVIRNNLGQALPVVINGIDGKQHHIEIRAGDAIEWPILDDYGPDFRTKLIANMLRIIPA